MTTIGSNGVVVQPKRVLRPRRWMAVSVVVATAVFLCGAGLSYIGSGWTWSTAGFAAISLVGLVGLVELAWSRIVLSEAELEVRTLWTHKRYAASRVASVTWEAGCGVALKLSDGTWAKLPDLGYNSQGLTNTIRAWLKRTKQGGRREGAAEEADAADDAQGGTRTAG